MAKSVKSIEASFEELDVIIEQLENPETNLDDSFQLYHKGIQLLKVCNDSIDKIEKKIIVLNENGEKNELL